MHALIEKYQLKGQIRWIAAQTDRLRNSELYRTVADSKGVFIQPALYEAFGLTVIEAMNCGLPTFATNQGGPAEIIVNGISGFHIDPNNGDESSNKIADFFQKCREDTDYWNRISAQSNLSCLCRLDQYAIAKFAESLEMVPRMLSENAGLYHHYMLSMHLETPK